MEEMAKRNSGVGPGGGGRGLGRAGNRVSGADRELAFARPRPAFVVRFIFASFAAIGRTLC